MRANGLAVVLGNPPAPIFRVNASIWKGEVVPPGTSAASTGVSMDITLSIRNNGPESVRCMEIIDMGAIEDAAHLRTSVVQGSVRGISTPCPGEGLCCQAHPTYPRPALSGAGQRTAQLRCILAPGARAILTRPIDCASGRRPPRAI